MPQTSPWADYFVGEVVGTYRLISIINSGFFGTIYKAQCNETGDLVAIKALLPGQAESADSRAEFEREGDLLMRLMKSSNVVTIAASPAQQSVMINAGDDKDPQILPLAIPYFVMELADACLETIVLNKEEVAWPGRLELWRGVVLGVHQMHLKKIAHRDLKSSNCLVFLLEQNATKAKVTDLGRSRPWNEASMHAAELYATGRGDLRYAPPEYLMHQGVDTPDSHRASDLYGLGSVLFELATGIGITQHALGYGPNIVEREFIAAHRGTLTQLDGLRSYFEDSYRLFGECVPADIRDRGVRLLRTLCDPVPGSRFPKTISKGRLVKDAGLDWLLQQSDILLRTLRKPSIVRRRYTKQKVQV